jgi:hypothetical protein
VRKVELEQLEIREVVVVRGEQLVAQVVLVAHRVLAVRLMRGDLWD